MPGTREKSPASILCETPEMTSLRRQATEELNTCTSRAQSGKRGAEDYAQGSARKSLRTHATQSVREVTLKLTTRNAHTGSLHSDTSGKGLPQGLRQLSRSNQGKASKQPKRALSTAPVSLKILEVKSKSLPALTKVFLMHLDPTSQRCHLQGAVRMRSNAGFQEMFF
ncbi:hypothetical protein PoB_004542800 [Plakobranchus ocellatus]|uniref:Uncharacterized protein n=1 Tax=Plakobranchus ocellatus TaxID=259542 RepID=A0AAV4BH51_9GAST|nr:hypothetical protein PoB_004542800 [Plakobranchus ocellatus]